MTEQLDKLRSSVGPLESEIIDAYASGSLSRRGFLVRGSVVGLSTAFMGAVIAACGDDKAATPETTAGGAATTAAPSPETTAAAPETTTAAGGIKQGGTLLTCSCSGLLSQDEFLSVLRGASRAPGRRVQVIEAVGPGLDHPVMTDCPESSYLKALWCRVM